MFTLHFLFDLSLHYQMVSNHLKLVSQVSPPQVHTQPCLEAELAFFFFFFCFTFPQTRTRFASQSGADHALVPCVGRLCAVQYAGNMSDFLLV